MHSFKLADVTGAYRNTLKMCLVYWGYHPSHEIFVIILIVAFLLTFVIYKLKKKTAV